jgi:hypothetical protein
MRSIKNEVNMLSFIFVGLHYTYCIYSFVYLTSILFFICSGKCSLEGPRERCLGSSGGGGGKWAGARGVGES